MNGKQSNIIQNKAETTKNTDSRKTLPIMKLDFNHFQNHKNPFHYHHHRKREYRHHYCFRHR